MKMKIKYLFLFLICILATAVTAWTPPSDADFRDYYNLYNVSVATGENATFNNFFGTLTGGITVASDMNFNEYSIYNATNVNATAIYQDGSIVLDNSDLPLANQTLPYCGNITGATSDLCTIVDTDFYWPLNETVLANESGTLGINKTFWDLNYLQIINQFVQSVDNIYLYMSGTNLTFNESKLNVTILDTDLDYRIISAWENITGVPTLLSNFTNDKDFINSSYGNVTYVNVEGDVMEGSLNMSNYTLYINDDFQDGHPVNDISSHLDNLLYGTSLDKTDVNFVTVGGVTNLTLTNDDGMDLHFNIDRVEYSDGGTMSVALTSGTNSTPQINYVTVQLSSGVPVLLTEGTYPSAEHVDISKVMVGSDGYIISWTPINIRGYGAIYETYERFEEQGCLYKEGFLTDATSTVLNITGGEMRCVLSEIETSDTIEIADGFFWIRNNGTYEWCIDFSCVDEYSDGTAFGTNKYMNVVVGVVALNKSTIGMTAVVQNYAGTGKEYVTLITAEQDPYSVTNFFPPDSNVKNSYTPIARIMINQATSQLQTFQSGLYYRFLGGLVTSGGSGPTTPTTNHDALSNLDYSNAGHTNFSSSAQLETVNTTAESKHTPGTCAAGEFIVNTTITGVECEAAAGGGTVTQVDTSGYITGGPITSTGTIELNETLLNATIVALDTDTTYTAGSNLSLAGTVFSADMAEMKLYWDTLYIAIANAFVYSNYFDQDLNTTSAVVYPTVDTGQGANELYDMDQNVLRASDVTYNSTNVTEVLGAVGTGKIVFNASGTYIFG